MCFKPKISTPNYQMPTQAPQPVQAAQTTPTGVQFGGQNETTSGMSEATVKPTTGTKELTVPKVKQPQTSTPSVAQTSETQTTAFDKLQRLNRIRGGSFSGGSIQ